MRFDSIYVLGSSISSSRIGNANDQTKNPFNKRLYLNSSNIPHSTIESMTPLALLNTCLFAYSFDECVCACVPLAQPLCGERASERHQRARACVLFQQQSELMLLRTVQRYEFSMTRLSHRFYLICVHSICYTHK